MDTILNIKAQYKLNNTINLYYSYFKRIEIQTKYLLAFQKQIKIYRINQNQQFQQQNIIFETEHQIVQMLMSYVTNILCIKIKKQKINQIFVYDNICININYQRLIVNLEDNYVQSYIHGMTTITQKSSLVDYFVFTALDQLNSTSVFKVKLKFPNIEPAQITPFNITESKINLQFLGICKDRIEYLMKDSLGGLYLIKQQNNQLQLKQKLPLYFTNNIVCQGNFFVLKQINKNKNTSEIYMSNNVIIIQMQEDFKQSIITSSIGICLFLVFLSNSIRQIYHFIVIKLKSMIRSFKIFFIIILLGLSLTVLIFQTHQQLKQSYYQQIFQVYFLYTYSLFIILFFTLTECNDQQHQNNLFQKILKLRGFNINNYIWSRISYLSLVTILFCLCFLVIQFYLLYLATNISYEISYFSDFNRFLLAFSGLFLACKSIIYTYLSLSHFLKQQIITNIIFFHILLHFIINTEFDFLHSNLCPLDYCFLIKYSNLQKYLYLLFSFHRKCDYTYICNYQQILLNMLIETLITLVIYTFILNIRYNSCKIIKSKIKNKKNTETLISDESIRQQRDNIIKISLNTNNELKQITKYDFQIYKNSIYTIYCKDIFNISQIINKFTQNKWYNFQNKQFQKQDQISICLQENNYYKNLTFVEHIRFLLKINKTKKQFIQPLIIKIIDDFYFQNQKNKLATHLSGGNLKKLILACSFTDNKKIIIIEQPTNALDRISKINFWKYLINKKQQGKTIILISSNIQLCSQISDYIYSFEQKRQIKYNQFQNISFSTKLYKQKNKKIQSIQFKTVQNVIQKLKDKKYKQTFQQFQQIMKTVKLILINSMLCPQIKIHKKNTQQNNLQNIGHKLQQSFNSLKNAEFNLKQQFKGIIIRKFKLINKINLLLIFINCLLITIIFIHWLNYISNWDQKFSKFYQLWLGELLFIKLISIFCSFYIHTRVDQKQKIISYFKISGLNNYLFFIINYLIDVILLYSFIIVSLLLLKLFSNSFQYGSLLQFLYWSFLYSIIYVLYLHILAEFIHQKYFIICFMILFTLIIEFCVQFIYKYKDIFMWMYYPYAISSYFESVLDGNQNLSKYQDFQNLRLKLVLYFCIQIFCTILIYLSIIFLKQKIQIFFRMKYYYRDLINEQNVLTIKQQYLVQDCNQLQTPFLVKNIHKYFGVFQKIQSLKNITTLVNKGQIYALIGPNGSGKTTILNTFTNSTDLDVGQIKIFGQNFLKQKSKYKIGYCPQIDILDLQLTVNENIDFIGRLKGLNKIQIKKFKDNFLHYFQLQQILDKKMQQLSIGKRRCISSVLVFMGKPSILFFDQPLVGIDVKYRQIMYKMIETYVKYMNAAVILTTHDLQQAEKHCNKIGIINKGRLVTVSSKQQLIQQHSTQYRISISYFSQQIVQKIIIKFREVQSILKHYLQRDKKKIIIDIAKSNCNRYKIMKLLVNMYENNQIKYFQFYSHDLKLIFQKIIQKYNLTS